MQHHRQWKKSLMLLCCCLLSFVNLHSSTNADAKQTLLERKRWNEKTSSFSLITWSAGKSGRMEKSLISCEKTEKLCILLGFMSLRFAFLAIELYISRYSSVLYHQSREQTEAKPSLIPLIIHRLCFTSTGNVIISCEGVFVATFLEMKICAEQWKSLLCLKLESIFHSLSEHFIAKHKRETRILFSGTADVHMQMSHNRNLMVFPPSWTVTFSIKVESMELFLNSNGAKSANRHVQFSGIMRWKS